MRLIVLLMAATIGIALTIVVAIYFLYIPSAIEDFAREPEDLYIAIFMTFTCILGISSTSLSLWSLLMNRALERVKGWIFHVASSLFVMIAAGLCLLGFLNSATISRDIEVYTLGILALIVLVTYVYTLRINRRR